MVVSPQFKQCLGIMRLGVVALDGVALAMMVGFSLKFVKMIY